MPVVQVNVPEGALSREQKREMVSRITDVVVEVEGIPQLRQSVHVLVTEIADGGYGVGGRAWTLDELTAAFGQKRSEGAAS
jgi:4-oxalocrotonate tautomerase